MWGKLLKGLHKNYRRGKTFSSWVRSTHQVMKHWWDMMEQSYPTMILPLNVAIKPGQMHGPAIAGIWRVNNRRQISEEDKNLKHHETGFKFTKFWILCSSYHLTLEVGTAMKVCSKSGSQRSHLSVAERSFQRGTHKNRKILVMSQRESSSGKQPYQVVYELLGSLLSCSCMDRILIRI